MATYTELYAIDADDEFKNRVAVAVYVAAQAILVEATPDAARTAWALNAIQDPGQTAKRIARLIVAANKTATVSQILSATDEAIQTNVDEVIDGLVAAGG